MKKDQQSSFGGWSEAIASIKLTEILYIHKDLPEEGRYKVISKAQDFYNPEEEVVTFYNLQDEDGKVYYMKLSQFQEEFEAIEV